MKNFFERPTTQDYQKGFCPVISKQLNLENLDRITKQKIISLYEPKAKQDFLAYRFEMLKQWMKKNKEYTKEYVVALDEMIEKLVLTNELNSFEQQYIKNIQAIVFAKNRNLKQLIVDFHINKNEFVFYRYDLDAFKQIDQNGKAQIINQLDMYITTQRIIFAKQLDIISIYYGSIKAYKYNRAKFSITLKSGRQCFVDSENNRAIYESLKRVIIKENITIK